MLVAGFLSFLALRFFWWYVDVQRTSVSKAAIVLGGCVAGFKLVFTQNVPAAIISGLVTALAAAGLVWVDRRFHSLASIPVWFVLSWILAIVLMGAI